jgi:hypothetical protein
MGLGASLVEDGLLNIDDKPNVDWVVDGTTYTNFILAYLGKIRWRELRWFTMICAKKHGIFEN